MTASVLTLLRCLCIFGTLLLPAVYIAMVNFHQEMIPTRLALSIIAAKRDVPFTTVFEVLLMLVAFEILQEAGLRLPPSIGQTVSIIGGLVVGTAAVEAKIVSPAVLIVVAAAGIAGYTMPSQEFAAALRLWRFLLALLAGWAGLFGVVVGAAVLILRLARLESFGVAYLAPFCRRRASPGWTACSACPCPGSSCGRPGSTPKTGGIRRETGVCCNDAGRPVPLPRRLRRPELAARGAGAGEHGAHAHPGGGQGGGGG